MRFSQAPSTLLSLLLVALSSIDIAQAWPLLGELDFSFLHGRDTCASYCGAQSQFCCTSGQACTTDNSNVAACVAATSVAVATGANGIPIYTTTWTETDLLTKTSTAYSYPTTTATAVAAPAPTAAAICTTSLGQTSCGTLCCASGQVCAAANSCSAYGSTWSYFEYTSAGSSYSAPLRPTSGGVSTATSVVSATTTQPFQSPATASGSSLPITSAASNNGLSPGAIAGIVIGTIAGIILLIIICFCCIVRAGFSGLLALFGLGKPRRSTERVETVERYSRHGSGTAASRRNTHTGWFGMGGGGRAKPASSRMTSEKKKKSSGMGGMGAVGAGLIGLAVVLGLKRKHDDKKTSQSRHAVSDVSSTYYTNTSYTGTSASKQREFRRPKNKRHKEQSTFREGALVVRVSTGE
ncbi:hypothetical protein LOCC1_G000066 [Lachnellula occidentalis]|uniref:GPI-anchored protein n=1 Tax=Lachnellula occidentalis TaxID=215460 RepID=A0A8H8S8I7_9HELO|nr:hypothetical protein LOCC1_G000066 [Lachnellula occidentalis]